MKTDGSREIDDAQCTKYSFISWTLHGEKTILIVVSYFELLCRAKNA